MEQDFVKNVLKPGDKGFQYDKRVDFSKEVDKVDDGWDDEEEDKGNDDNDDEYFDDDFN